MKAIRTRIEISHFGLNKLTDTMAKVEGLWIEVEEENGVFSVVNENFPRPDGELKKDTTLTFIDWDNEVEDIDNGDSEESTVFGRSRHLRWQDVDLTPNEFRAPTVERLKEALNHVAFYVWCPDDL